MHILRAVLLALAVSLQPAPPVVDTWTPPIGIPAPSFGITETVASTHGSDAFRTKTISGGGDLSAKMPPLSPGDVLVIEAGRYTMRADTTWRPQGTAQAPIFVRGASSDARPVITLDPAADTDSVALGGKYVVYENLEFDLSTHERLGVELTGDHVALRTSDVHGGAGWRPATALIVGGNNLVIYRNAIHDNGHVTGCDVPNCDPDYHGITMRGDHNWILENDIYRNGGDGIQLNPGDASAAKSLHHVYIGRNDLHDNRQTGVWVKFSADIIISENLIHGHRPTAGTTNGSGQGTGSQYGAERVWWLYNNIFNNSHALSINSDGGPGGNGNGQDQYIIGNVMHGNLEQTYMDWDATARKHFVNNTIVGGTVAIDSTNERAGSEFVNNIFVGNTGATLSLTSNRGVTVARNLCGDGACRVVDVTCANCMSGDPMFVAPTGKNGIAGDADDDFRLRPGSPAIDQGTASTVYATFETLYGLSIARDAAGTPRPQGGNWDLGAFEVSTTATPARRQQ